MNQEIREAFQRNYAQQGRRDPYGKREKKRSKYGNIVFSTPPQVEKVGFLTRLTGKLSNFRLPFPEINYVKTSILFLIITSFTLLYSGDSKMTRQTLLLDNAFAEGEETKEVTDEEREKQREIEQAVEYYRNKENQQADVLKNLKLLNELKERQKSMEERELELKNKEEQIKIVEGGIDAKIADMQKLKKQLEELILMRKDLGEKNIKQLVKVYENMKPAEAANVLEKLEEDISVQVLKRMKGKKAGKILNVMKPAKAVRLSEELARVNPPDQDK